MAVIDFRQVAAPSFAGSNTLVAMAARQQEQAAQGIQDTWNTAASNVQNRVQGEMQGLINTQSKEQLTDPIARQTLQNQLTALAAPSGDMYDPMVMNTYMDNRANTLVSREGAVLNNTDANITIQGKRQDNEFDAVSNGHEVLKMGREVKGWKADDVAKEKEKNFTEAMGGYELFRTAAGNYEKDSPMYAQHMQKASSYIENANLTPAERVKLIEAIDNKFYSGVEKKNKLTIQGQTIDKNAVNIDLATQSKDLRQQQNDRANFALDLKAVAQSDKSTQDKQKSLDALSTSNGGGVGEYYVDKDGTAKTNWDRVRTRINGQSEMIKQQIENPDGIEDFGTYVRSTVDKNGEVPDARLINSVSEAFTKFNAKATKQGKPIISEARKMKIYSDYLSGEMKNDTWWNLRTQENFIEKYLPNALDKVLIEEKNKTGVEKRKFYSQQFNNLNQGEDGGSYTKTALQLGLNGAHPDYDYFPDAVKKLYTKKKK